MYDSITSPAASEVSPVSRVRIRGIYATALTELLSDEWSIVAASAPIQERFDEPFSDEPYDITIETSGDRLGVSVAGSEVSSVTERIASVGIDALTWHDPTPNGAIYDTVVEEALGSGAVVRLTDDSNREGFLPYGRSDDYVDDGDRLRVQVVDPTPPWSDDRPVVGTTMRASAGPATLIHGTDGVSVDGDAPELAGLTDLLSTDVPDGWGLQWDADAVNASLDALDETLSAARADAEALETALSGAPDPEENAPREVVSPRETAWIWFGRETRFELDGRRRRVTGTMPGHHRIKVAGESASTGVDLVEALCDGDDFHLDDDDDPTGSFPFEAVTRALGPSEGDHVRISHGKPRGETIVLGRAEVVSIDADGGARLRRTMRSDGTYDALGTPRERGDEAVTSVTEGRWWYPTVYRGADGEHKGTYVNICTPVELFPDEVRYVDLHVDVIRHPDGTVERVDDDELDAAVEAGYLDEELAEKARTVAAGVERALS